MKSDVSTAKNYMTEKEIKGLERLVSRYLDYAEDLAARMIPMTMKDWVEKLDGFLKFNEYKILDNPGKVRHEAAKKMAEAHYEKFRVIQDREFESDFDKEVKKISLPRRKINHKKEDA